ncbi:non-ribosomal peptide synthetase [Xanthomonas sp. LMG 12462]|uniref:non-ribosomal peptide synthetase n=1 Tax=Xanthomonas sp. LMG 12462 TaxID=1591134 RepID=UPI00126599EA|nr:non-ribosomal peptide synthetase [Xanthomonas sp. LMG 12462]KAB7770806.1 non-ribosomal peptide synthetase [Xanthomonas sp. LMG 12462]
MLRSVLEGQRVDLIDCTPSLLEAWLGAGLEDCLPHLVIGGEAIGASLWQRLVGWQQQRGRLAINVYGPTECCVDTTWSLVQGPVPVIGRALANVQCHVLAEDGQVQPIGVAGELYIGGAGVGRGYHGQPALTAQRFLPSPWVAGERVYRSGDRVRWRNDGTLEYLGRLDAQVKLRGYRIELGEIESQLRAQATVREAAVVVSGEGAQARLVAYVVPATPLELEDAEASWTQSLQQALSQVLPGYMQPTAYVVLAALPLTANGKLDRAALPQAQVREAAYSAPRTPTEQALAQIWEAVLGQERISTEANFFEIGGDSILSIQIVARANQAGIGISTRQLFQSQTIAQLARHADHAKEGTGMLATQAEVQGALPLLPIQRAFLEANDRDPHHYNQALLLEAPAALDPIDLHRMVAALYRRHDALRLRFRLQEGQWLAEHAPLDDATLEAACVIERLPDEPLAFARAVSERCDHWQGAFELDRGPLLRAVYLHNDAQARLLLVAHHLVVDGVSWRILLADLGSAHAQAAAGEEIVLPPKTVSLQQWAQAVHAHAGSHALAAERSYWLAQARRTLPPLPVDRAGTDHGPVCSAAHVGFALPDAVSRILLQHGNRAYRTQVNELLLAGVLLGMRRWSGHAGLRLGLEGHGRGGLPDELDTSQTVGWFTTLYPLLLWSDADDVASTIKAVKEQYRAVPAQGLGYAVLRELTADPELRAAEEGQPIALTFNYLGQSDHAAEQAGPFRAAPESAGHSIGPHRLRRHALTLKGVAAAGQLRFTLEYSRDRYDAETASAIVAALESAFHAVAGHCAQCERPALTPSDVPLAQLSQEPLDALQAAFPDMVALYPATPMQQGLLFHTRLDPEAYITQTFPILRGALDAPRFRAAWQSLLDRHEVFRTAFVEVGERLLQLVGASAALPWHEEDWRELDAQAQEAQFERYRQQDRARGFDVACAPLLRIALFRLGEERYRLLWTHHHMLSDGWSLPILYKEVMQVYTAGLQGTSVQLPPAPRYEAYVDWLSRQDRDAALAFWQSQLATIEAPTPLAIDKLPSDGGFGQRERSLTLDAATSERLSAFARGQRVTLNTVLQLAWGYLLHRYSGEDEVVFGATISGRPAEIDGIESMVGLFINSVPVRMSFAEPHSVGTMLADLQQRFERANAFGYLSLADIQRQSGIAPGTALFDSLMVIGNYPIEAAMQARSLDAGLQVEATGRREQTGYRLAFNIGVRSRIHLQCAYPAEVFADATIDRLLGHFAQVLQRMPALVDQPVHRIDPLGDAEHRDRALWNAVPADYPRDATLHALVEARAHAHPQAVAATFGEQAITYGELNREANRVAHFLRQRGVAVDTLVGLCIERSVEMLIGMLGILKAGAAYLPLDPDYPEDRLRFMLEDSGAEIVLTSSDLLHALDVFDERLVLPLDATLREALLGDCAQTDPVPAAGAQSLAYAIYTSGSTGTPKGTLIEHRNVVRLVHRPNYVVLAEGEVMAQASNSSFDAATFEIWGALANGMHLHGIGKDTLLNPAALATTLHEARVATLFVTTAIFNQMSLVAPGGFAALDTLLFGGEGVDVEAVGRVLAAGKPRHLVHVYGPTENTTFSTAFEIVERRFDTYPIGTPISGTTLYVLDTQRRPVPYGAVGELYLGGDGVGRGYHARPQLDAERFLEDPFAVTDGARLYRTGDLVRQSADGNVQFVGRADDQVKLRGFRIELGEIETRLLSHDAVREAVVVARRDQDATRLVAYVVRTLADEQVNESLFSKELRRYLKQRMPEYMVPSAFVCMEELPLTRNGKVDKRQLPVPDYQLQQAYFAPRTELEARLAELWQQVLRVDQVGVHDNFFEIGGDSILSIQVVSRANQAGIRMSTRQLFENQTVAELATVAACAEEALAPQDEVQGEMPLLPVQRMFLEGEAVDRHHFNQAVLLTTPPDFDLQTLDAVLAALYARHDALRLRFTEDADGWQARHVPLHPDMVLESRALERLEGSDSTWAAQVSARCADWQRRFDLADGPLLRAVYFPSWTGDGGRLLLAVHHIVVDGVSWRILLDDLQLAYSQIQRGQSIQLGRKSASFQRWGQTLEAYACDPALLQEKAYWAAAAAVPGLPVDRPGVGAGSNASTRLIGFGLSPEETRALQQQCHAAYRTQINELLLAAVYLGVRRWCGQTALRIRLEGHGREALDEDMDLTQTVGWFTSLYPLRLSSDGQALGDVIKAVKEQYRSVPRRGIGYGVLRYLLRDPDLIAAAHDEHDGLLFNYLGQFDQVLNDDTAFQPAPESIGPQTSLRRQRAALLSLSGKTFAGQLQFTLSYGSDRYEAASMRALADAIEGALREIVAHCRHAHGAGFTPSDFPLARVGQAELDRWQHRYPRLQRLYPATPMQAGLLYETLLDRSAYVIQNYPVLRGDLDLAAFRQAWHAVVARHDVFRTAFVGDAADLQQLVLEQAPLEWQEEDWSVFDDAEQARRFEAFRQQDRQRGFDFAQPPLMRVAVFHLGAQRYQLLWSLHHILLDGWCLPLVYRDVIELYRAALEVRAPQLPAVPPYEHYIAWLQARDAAAAREYWRRLLQHVTAPTPLPMARPPVPLAGQREHWLELSEAQTQVLLAFAQAHRTTVNTLLQWAWAYLLHRYSGEADVVFGATISGRAGQVAGIEDMVGLFINSIPVKVSFGNDSGLAAALSALHADFQQGSEYGYLALSEIQRQSGVRAGTALFDSLLVFENYPMDALADDAGTSASTTLEIERPGNSEATSFALTLTAGLGRTLRVKFGYRGDRFCDMAVRRTAEHLARVLDQMSLPERAADCRFDLPTDAERAQFAVWNETDAPFPRETCVHTLFEVQAALTPDAVALEASDTTLTYAALNMRANQLAHALIGLGVAPDDRVGLRMHRSIDLVVAILAVLKAGGAYLPLDPEHPPARTAYMVRDSGARIVVTTGDLERPLLDEGATVLALDAEPTLASLAEMPVRNPEARERGLGARNLAYAIYTSGSTGEPKCVLNEHEALVNRLDWMQKAYPLGPDDRVLQKTPFSFDVSVWEFLWPLLAGARLSILAPGAHQDPAAVCDAIRRHGITTLHFVPSMLSVLLAMEDWASCRSVRQVLCSGEALSVELAQRFFATGTQARLHNLYGPTEAAIDVSAWECRPGDTGATVPIGRPIQNLRLHVLDASGALQVLGVPGELCIGGVGLARGYCNKPELTRERFIADSVDGLPGARLYRTGDLARWLPDGSLEFLGRLDHQVKLRGLRIELGEIEAQLRRQAGVDDAVVVVRGDAEDSVLVAYLAMQDAGDPAGHAAVADRLRAALADALPSYMLPAAFVVMARLPLNANGKLDRAALPELQTAQGGTDAATPTERVIAELWQTLLKRDAVDVTASFFALGGHSLLAVRMIGEVRSLFDLDISIRDVFERTSVRALAAHVDACLQRRRLHDALALDVSNSNPEELIEL